MSARLKHKTSSRESELPSAPLRDIEVQGQAVVADPLFLHCFRKALGKCQELPPITDNQLFILYIYIIIICLRRNKIAALAIKLSRLIIIKEMNIALGIRI